VSGRGRICFFAPYLWPSFSDRAIEFAGGAEVQQAALARGLAARGFEVTVGTCDYGQGRRVEREGITFLATHPPFAGLPVLRFFHPRLTGNVRALLASRAEVFYERGSGMQAGLAADLARLTRAGFVFAAAHDSDAQRGMPLVEMARDRWWYARAVPRADCIVAQTAFQQRLFREQWKRESIVIPNLVEVPAHIADAGGEGAVLWLSTYKASKRPEWVIEIARRLPSRRFVMAGVVPPPPLTAEAFEATRAAAQDLPNLEVLGHVKRADLGAFFARGALLVHTSDSEGFPNTLLEAWAHGLPSVSIYDPDGVVARERLGEVVSDADAMAEAVDRWMADPAGRRETGARARAHVEAWHSPAIVVDRLVEVLDGVIAEVRARR
jgi:glycosyltransferase involved in cell wall biosynthesis